MQICCLICKYLVYVLPMQTLATNDNNAFGYYSVIKYFEWRKVMILYHDIDAFERVSVVWFSIHTRTRQICSTSMLTDAGVRYIFSQGVHTLEDLLKHDGIEVELESFETDEGIQGLGENPFVRVSHVNTSTYTCTRVIKSLICSFFVRLFLEVSAEIIIAVALAQIHCDYYIVPF